MSSNGAALIAAERQRQIDAEGYIPEHDDEHGDGSLAIAAACYAANAGGLLIYERHDYANVISFANPWPWDAEHDKRPHDGNVVTVAETDAERLRLLVKAGALIAAEIDRLQRRSDSDA